MHVLQPHPLPADATDVCPAEPASFSSLLRKYKLFFYNKAHVRFDI